MKIFWRVLLVIALAVGGFLAYRHFFPNDEDQIRRRLTQLATTASIPSDATPVGSAVAVQRLSGYFTPEADIAVDVDHAFANREELLQAVGLARLRFKGVTVEFLDINVAVDPSRTTAKADLTLRVAQSGDLLVRLVKLQLRKDDGNWRITHGESAKVLN